MSNRKFKFDPDCYWIGHPYYIRLNNHPDADRLNAQYYQCIDRTERRVTFATIIDGEIEKLTLTPEDVIKYNIDIQMLYSAGAIRYLFEANKPNIDTIIPSTLDRELRHQLEFEAITEVLNRWTEKHYSSLGSINVSIDQLSAKYRIRINRQSAIIRVSSDIRYGLECWMIEIHNLKGDDRNTIISINNQHDIEMIKSDSDVFDTYNFLEYKDLRALRTGLMRKLAIIRRNSSALYERRF